MINSLDTCKPISAAEHTRQQEDEHREWLLDEALAESFPASDSPAISLCSPSLTSEPGRGSGRRGAVKLALDGRPGYFVAHRAAAAERPSASSLMLIEQVLAPHGQ